LRITPSKDGDFRLSEKAIPFYYALESNKQDDDLVLNWSFHKTTRNWLHQLYSYRYINPINHPLRERMDGHNFYRIEGTVGKPLANVMRNIANQRRRLGLDFAIEPVFISSAVLGGDESEKTEADALKRARGALLKMLRCRFSDLNLVFLVMTSSIFNYLLPVIAALAQLDPGKLIADPTDDSAPATDGLVATPLLTLLGGTSARHLQPKLSGTILNTLRPEVYVKGQLTEKLKPTNDPKTSVGMLYTVVKDATDSSDLFDRVEEFARELAPAAGVTDELVAKIYRPVSLLARAEEILELVKTDSIVDFDFDLFESRYKGFAKAYRKFVEEAAKAKDKPGSKTARARQVVIDNFNALAGSGASGLIASLSDEFEALRGKWEKSGLTAWDFGDLPDHIRESGKIRAKWVAYPALVKDPQTNKQVNLRLFQQPDQARTAHLAGVLTLYSIHFAKDLKFLKRQLVLPADKSALADYFGGARQFEKRLYQHILQTLFSKDIRLQKEFIAYAEQTGPKILSAGRELLERTLPVLTAYHEARSQIYRLQAGNRINPKIQALFKDLLEGLERLVPENFVELYHKDRYIHLERYIKALTIRAQRAPVDFEKDQAKAAEVRRFADGLNQLLKTLSPAASEEKRQAIEDYFWMLEEYKVSVFAQELKTAIPISAKRLKDKLGQIERMV